MGKIGNFVGGFGDVVAEEDIGRPFKEEHDKEARKEGRSLFRPC